LEVDHRRRICEIQEETRLEVLRLKKEHRESVDRAMDLLSIAGGRD